MKKKERKKEIIDYIKKKGRKHEKERKKERKCIFYILAAKEIFPLLIPHGAMKPHVRFDRFSINHRHTEGSKIHKNEQIYIKI